MDLLTLRVFYNPYSIAIILALVAVTSQFWVTIYTNNVTAMFFHTVPGSILNFYQWLKVLYNFDSSAPNIFNPSVNDYHFLNIFQ